LKARRLTRLTVEPLSPVLGASIVSLDFREPMSEITKRAVYDGCIRYHVQRRRAASRTQKIIFAAGVQGEL
jgi:hypothetical protein